MFSSQMTHCSCKQTITAKVESYPDKYSQHMDSGLLRAHSNFHDKQSEQLRRNVDLVNVDIFFFFFQK